MRSALFLVPAYLGLFVPLALAAPPFYPDAHRAYEEHWRAHPEHYDDLVRHWHTRLFHRDIPAPLLVRWGAELRRGIEAPVALAHVLASQEYYVQVGSSPEGFVRRTFVDIVGRPPTEPEFHFWLHRLYHADRGIVAQEMVTRYPPTWIEPAPAVVPAPVYEYRPPAYRYR